jgi:hypothetical protein
VLKLGERKGWISGRRVHVSTVDVIGGQVATISRHRRVGFDQSLEDLATALERGQRLSHPKV